MKAPVAMELPAHSSALPRNLRPASDTMQQQVKSSVHRELIGRMDLNRLGDFNREPAARVELLSWIHRLLLEQSIPLSSLERDRLAQEVLDEVFGLGPLEPLLKDPTVDDILVNTCNAVYVERRGVLERTNVVFTDNRHLLQIIDKIVSAVGRRIDEASPMVDARLADGSRINAIIPPLALDGPILSIRRFGQRPLSGQDLVKTEMLTAPMLDLLRCAVEARLNIIISGGTGAGKTTLLNVLSDFISPRERIVTIEDSAELQLRQEHVVRLETRPPNVEGKGAVRQRELMINALRMRPDRIVLGEVRGEEALDMLQAMNTGHDGSLTTVHANSPRDALTRLETMCLMGDIHLPEKAIRAQVASAIQLLVQVARLADGSRRITHITELTGSYGEALSTNDLFLYERKGFTPEGKSRGRFYATGILQGFAERLAAHGVTLPRGLQQHSVEV